MPSCDYRGLSEHRGLLQSVLGDYRGPSNSDSNAGGLWVTEVGDLHFGPETTSHGPHVEAEGREERRRRRGAGKLRGSTFSPGKG